MDLPSYQQMNETSASLLKAYQAAAKVLLANYDKDPDANWQDMKNISEIYHHWFAEVMENPSEIWQAQISWWQDAWKIYETYQPGLNPQAFTPLVMPGKRDKRFKSSLWQEYASFYMIQQMYLMFTKHCQEFIQKHPSKDPRVSQQIEFFTQQILDAISPTNFVLTNPQVLQQTIESRGENLIRGYQNFLDDLVQGQGHFMVKMTDMSAFHVGENLAATPGEVVFQNNLIELIQYNPSTKKVYERPLLMVPPWINKFYILDLRAHNSLAKWTVDQGITVFMISWKNPDKNDSDVTFSDYMTLGVLDALEAIEKETGIQSVNALGFCVGGTLLATTLSYLAQKQNDRIHSATFLTSLIDFSDPGEIGVFIDEKQLQALDKRMEVEGYLDGRLLMNTFNMLRSNDLLWSYYVNNYLCGQEPFPFDVLFWNCDSTNLPAAMHRFYLRHFYLNNELIQGELPILDVLADIHDVTVPAYFISTAQDHIAPWKTTFKGAQALKGPVTFVLGASGHIAGIVNPPCNEKYDYQTTSAPIKDFKNAEDWLEAAESQDGSWWTHWGEWIKTQSGSHIAARQPGQHLPIVEKAPGEYVKKRIL